MRSEDVVDSRGSIPSRTRWLWLWGAGCVVVIIMAFVAGMFVRSPWEAAIANAESTPTVTAVVEQRTINPERDLITGTVTLGRDETVTVIATDAPRQVVTQIHTKKGETLTSGTSLATVSGRPLIALHLPFDLYRDIHGGDSGDDVTALQQELTALGHYSGTIDGTYGARTAAAVEALYNSVGAQPPAVSADARATLTEARAELRALRTAASASPTLNTPEHQDTTTGPTANDSTREGASDTTRASANDITAAQQRVTEAEQQALTPLPYTEIWRLSTPHATVVSTVKKGADLAATDQPLATLRSGDSTVTFRATTSQTSAFTQGSPVDINLTSDATQTWKAVVTKVSDFTTEVGDNAPVPGRDITVTIEDPTGLHQDASVIVRPTTAATDVHGLAVPIVALRNDAGRTTVTVITTRNGDDERTSIPVTVTATGDGYSIVESTELHEGDRVVISE